MKYAILPLVAALWLASCGTPGTGQNPPTIVAPSATSLPATTLPTTVPTTTIPPTNAPATTLPTTTIPPTNAPPTSVPAPPTPMPPTAVPSTGSTILFLRDGNLWAFDLTSRQERQLAEHVSDVATTPDGSRIVLVRSDAGQIDLWSIQRDGSGLTRLTNDPAIESSPSWTAAGDALVYASGSEAQPAEPDWPSWGSWCVGSQVQLLELASGSTRTLAEGCAPAIAPDGTRVAYASPPTERSFGSTTDALLANNRIRLVNRQGQNGWDFARAGGGATPAPNQGELVYGPAWSPDGAQLVYHRFIGYRALVDLNLIEISPSFQRAAQPLGVGAGWLLPARVAPGGRLVALTQHNYSDARGGSGYALWSVTLIRLEGSREIVLPDGPITALGQEIDKLPCGQQVAWSPDGAELVVQLPPNWQAGSTPGEPGDPNQPTLPGEIWRWQPGSPPSERLVSGVDPASPLVWLP